MSLTGIISVSGLPGLHKILSHTKNGLIVESLIDGKRRPIYASQKVSALEDISIYTSDDDLPLTDVFKLISEKEAGKAALDHKMDPEKLREYLTGIVKDLDQDRVYNSDISKLFQWYNLLVEKDLLKDEEEEEKKKESKKEKEGEGKAKKAPAKKAPVKAAAGKSASSKKAPAKKATAQRKASGRKS